ncbi:MAG TPA: alkaline phosphatase family protein [Bryobacteraceae bacterium]|jgi:phospholipase C|nr:alkaline phosphatase family protein [Bryobacteraceae bacterium]
MNRRTFLKQTGAAAAVTPLVAANLDAAVAQIKHIVVVMMENRSFDHLLGWLPGADGIQAGQTYLDKDGHAQATHELAPDFTGCAFPDPDHSYSGGRVEYGNGQMNGFLLTASPGLNAIGYYKETDLPFRSALARNYVTCDRYFCSTLAPTFPNRIFQHSGQTDRLGDDLSICSLPTIWDNLRAADVSHKYYFSNIPYLALWGLKYLDICALYADFLSDSAAGTLPAVSFVEPSFTTLTNLDEDDHPFSDVRNGDAFLSRTFHALSKSPNWSNTVFIINFDEWGGFYDHVAPPRAVAPNNADTDLVNGKALLGFRVPCIIASPWTTGNPANPTVNHSVFDHTSVLKLIETVFDVAPLAAREESDDVGNLLTALNLANPQTAVPALPQPGSVIPSSLCLSSINPAEIPARVSPELTNRTLTVRDDEESTVFLQMINSGMLKGFPGY